MKRIILTCDTGARKPARFLIDIDEFTGDARIVNERAPLIERDRSAFLSLATEHTPPNEFPGVVLSVEAA